MKSTLKKYPELQGFFEFDSFNPIQNDCLPKIMEKEDNLIVSAPTSSGKTVLFEFAILKYSHLPSPMCLYLAPIKSLCHQKYSLWEKKFGRKMSVAEVTGDNLENNQQRYLSSHITIGTPEKVDFLSRQSLEYLKKIRLLLIDEVHMLNFQERGATLEAIVSRIMSLNNKIRIISVSATIPNISQVGEWLKVPRNSICVFGEEFRPAKIKKVVLGFKLTGNPFTFEKSLNFKLLETVRFYSQKKGSLIFCPTQKGTESACQTIIAGMVQRQFIEDDKQLTSLVQAARQVSNSTLQIIIPQGIAFHNASLSMQDRNIVERLFLDLKIKILCTTSTLSMGINLPARLVIIKSTQSYKGAMKGYQEYSRIEIDQMMGRAGRPPFDTEGTVVIMTEKQNFQRYNSTHDLQNLQSQLFTQMLEHLNAQISLGSISSLQDVQEYIRNSFCFIRMKKSPSSYGIVGSVEEYVAVSCRKAVQTLASLNIITFNAETWRIFPRSLSNSISRSTVEIKSIAHITKLASKICSEKDYLFTLCSCPQIGRYNSKIQQRKILKSINDNNRFVLKQAISNSERKSFVIAQAQLSKFHIEFWQLRRQASDILTLLKRLNYCVKVLGVQLKNFCLFYWSIRFQKYFSAKFWEAAHEQVLLQFTGLEDKSKLLSLRGIRCVDDLKKNLSNITGWLQKSETFQKNIETEISCYEQAAEIKIINEEKQRILKIRFLSKFIGKLKGIHVCVGDSKNSLYFQKFVSDQSKQACVTLPKTSVLSYKIGIIKEGIIGFDELYLLQGQSITKFTFDSQQKSNRKSFENHRSHTAIKEKKSKSQEIRKKFNERITNNKKGFALNKQSIKSAIKQQDNYQTQVYNSPFPNKGERQLKLPPRYQIRQPIQPLTFDDDPIFKKEIKKEAFKYKPLNEYKWKPGFEQIDSSSEQEKVPKMKSLMIVDSKNKQFISSSSNLCNIYSSKPQNMPNPFKNERPRVINQSRSISTDKQKTEHDDVFSYFYNLF